MSSKTLLLVAAFVPAVLVGATVTLEGEQEYYVAADKTNTVSDVLTGSGSILKTGEGLLVLTGQNTFTGGIKINAGTVKISSNAAAIGKGPVTLNPSSSAAGTICRLYINKSGTYANEIIQAADGYSGTDQGDYSAGLLIEYDVSDCTFTGKITANGNMYIRPRPKNTGNDGGAGPTVKFNGEISAPGKTLVVASYGSPTFNGKVTCAAFKAVDAWSSGGTITLANEANEIGSVRVRHNVVKAGANGAFGGARFTVEEAWGTSGKGCLNLNGTVQRVAGVEDSSGFGVDASTDGGIRSIESSTAAKLIVTGDATSGYTSKSAVGGLVSVVVDAEGHPDFVQTFSTRTSGTKGDLVVSNGTLKIAGTASFRQVPTVVVGPNGKLDVQSTAETSLLAVRQLKVDGTFVTTRSDTLANSVVQLALSSGAKFTLPSDCELTVTSLSVDGQDLPGGRYSGSQYGIASGTVIVPAGILAITVPAGETRVYDAKVTGETTVIKGGPGALKLTNAENDFTGGVVINEGELIVDGTTRLGTGTITVNSTGTSQCRLNFTGSATLANDIMLNGDSNDSYPAIFFPKETTKTNVLTGKITCSGNAFFRHDRGADAYPAPGSKSFFEGEIDAAGHTVCARVYGELHLKGKVTAGLIGGTDAYSAGGRLYLYPDRYDVGGIQAFGPFVTCTAPDVLTNRFIFSTKGWSGGGSRLDMNGNDQTVTSLTSEDTSRSYLMSGSETLPFHGAFSDAGAPTLTIVGEAGVASRETFASFFSAVTLRLDARNNADFVQKINGRPNQTTGGLEVVKGTLQLLDRASFKKISRLFVGAEGVLDATGMTESPFPGEIGSIELEDGATLKVPADTVISAKQVTVGGQTYTAGTFKNLPELQGGIIIATGVAATSRWTGAAADGLVSTDGNWDVAPNLTFGSAIASFGDDNGATVDADALFSGLVFENVPGAGFTLMRDATPHTLEFIGRVDARASGATQRQVIDVPTVVRGEFVADAADKQDLVFKDAFVADDSLSGKMRLGGAGAVSFEGTNVMEGACYVTSTTCRVSGLLATPGHADQGEPAQNGANTLTIIHPGWTVTGQNYGLCVSNGVVEKPVFISNQIGRRSIWSPANTTNEIRGKVRFAVSQGLSYGAWQPIFTDAGAELTFSGGAFFSHSFRPMGSGTVRFVGKPVNAMQQAGLNPSHTSHVIVETTGNTFTNVCIGYASNIGRPTLEFTVSGAMTNGNLLVGVDGGGPASPTSKGLGDGPYTLDLHVTTQRCSRVAVTDVGVVRGGYPAMVEVFDGRAAGQSAGFAVSGRVEGGVGFHMCGRDDCVLTFTNATFASCGDLKVSSGTMEFAKGASWPNGTNVTVCGTGTLKLTGGGKIGRKTVLAISDSGRLSIPAGEQMSVKFATLNGQDVTPGTYRTGALEGAVTGGGDLVVRGGGMLLLVR